MAEKTAKEKTIATQYAELHKFSQNEEYERALKAANKSEQHLTYINTYGYLFKALFSSPWDSPSRVSSIPQ